MPAAQAALKGREIAWVEDPLDALVLQIQGSGRLQITEPDGRQRLVRLAFAGHNDQPYKSVGRWLIQQGELKSDGANWPAITPITVGTAWMPSACAIVPAVSTFTRASR